MRSSLPLFAARACPGVLSYRPSKGHPPRRRHSVYNDVGPVKTKLSVHFFRSVFSFLVRILFFCATKVRAVIIGQNTLGSTTHLFDPDPRRNQDYFFELPYFSGEAGRPLKRSVLTATTE